jgi:hypothetical protein
MASALSNNMRDALNFVRSEIIRELTEQGHRASGKTFSETEIKIFVNPDGVIGQILMPSHVIILDKGVRPDRVPFRPGSGAKSSKYIDALMRWIAIVKPGLSEYQRKSFAFAIAYTAKRGGHPTRGSYAFSKNGRRTGWAAVVDQAADVTKILSLLDLGDYLIAVVDNFISQYQRYA